MEFKKCPKCGSEMINDKQLGSYIELTLRTKSQYVGDKVLTFYCANCGFIELYKEMKKQVKS